MADIVIIQTSLNPSSKTSIVANKFFETLKEKGVNVEILDLRNHNIEFCDGRKLEKYNQDMQIIASKLKIAKGYILSFPIYNYSFSGVLKNFLDIYSGVMDSKFTGLVSNSGGIRSANEGVGELMKSLALHNNITTVQPVVHTFAGDFNDDNELTQDTTKEMIKKLCDRISEKI